MKRIWALCFVIVGVAVGSTASRAGSVDAYVAPIATFNYPFFQQEYSFSSPQLKADPRIGFRIESGLLEDGVSLDFRFATRSYYTDYGLSFRFFGCTPTSNLIFFCFGSGIGATYSSGFPTDGPGRTFFDVQINPFIRMIVDTQSSVAFVLEGGVEWVPDRNFSTKSPVARDTRTKLRVETAVGLLFDFESVDQASNLSVGGAVKDEDLASGFKWGVKGGFPLTRISEQGYPTHNSGGVAGGATMDLGFGNFGLTADLLYASRRFITDVIPSTGASQAVTYEQIEVPVQLRFRNLSSSFLLGTLGGYFALPLGNATVSSAGTTLSVTNQARNPDFGLLGGVGFGVASRLVTLQVEARLGFGLVNVLKTTPKATSRTLDFLVGFLF